MERFVVGIDLKEEYAQISYHKSGMTEPETLSATVGTDDYRIPTKSIDEVLKKAHRLLRTVGKLKDAAALVVSVKDVDADEAAKIREAAQNIGIPAENVCVQSDLESFSTYVMHQQKDIHMHNVALFCCEGNTLTADLMILNQKKLPVLIKTERVGAYDSGDFSALEDQEKDRIFSDLLHASFDSKRVSAAFLVGEGFSDRWYEKSLPLLCSGRRVFAGNNLFSKGACYKACELAGENVPFPYLFFGEEKIPCSVGIRVLNPAGDVQADDVQILIPAGRSWYEAEASCEVLLFDQPQLEIVFRPVVPGPSLKETMELPGLPERPARTTRLSVNIRFLSADSCGITVRDLGFGELFPAADTVWEESVELS